MRWEMHQRSQARERESERTHHEPNPFRHFQDAAHQRDQHGQHQHGAAGPGNSVRCVNEGPSPCFISIGAGTQTATLPNATPTGTSTPVLAGEDCVFTIPNDAIYNISAICRAAGTATL